MPATIGAGTCRTSWRRAAVRAGLTGIPSSRIASPRSWARRGCAALRPGKVEAFARINGLLDLASTDDTRILTARLWADGAGDVVLTASEEAAYARVAERMNTMWASGSALDRWTY